MNTFSEVLLFTVLNLIGIRILFHDLDELSEISGLQELSMTKIVASFVICDLILLVLFGFDVVIGLMSLILACLTPRIYVFYRRHIITKQLCEHILPLLDRIILFISAGNSLQESSRRALNGLKSEVADSFEVLIFRQEARFAISLPADIARFLEIHCYLQENTHQSTQLLKRFRQGLQVQNEFERKFRSSMAGIYIQISMLGFLYVLAAIGMSIYIEAERIRGFFAVSFLFVLLGTGAFILLQRRFKWSA